MNVNAAAAAVLNREAAPGWKWLLSRRFDLFFIFGIVGVAIATGVLVATYPEWFRIVLVLDLWFLGYHHVISTYTRLCFDRESFQARGFLLWFVLPVVALCTLAAAYLVGVWAIVSIYFYWQWWHYTRQSWGISRTYRGKDSNALYEDGWCDQAVFYALPVLGIVSRSVQDPGKFLGLELQVIPAPWWAVHVCEVLACALLAYWIARRIHAWRTGRLARAHTLYMLSHFAIFAVGYVLIEDISHGWLAINIWHNAQYILFVWMFNVRRFRNGVDPSARFLSYISQADRVWLYMLTCLAITGIFYWTILGTLDALFAAGLSLTIVLYQTVNFHHYVVDSSIWKVRKPAIRRTLGITG